MTKERNGETLVETIEPKKGSAPLIYGLTLAGVFLAVLVRNLLLAAGLTWAGNIAVALLAAFAFLLIRTRLVSYRYTLTGSFFAIERITGKKPVLAAKLELGQIDSFGPAAKKAEGVQTNVFTCRGKTGAMELRFFVESAKMPQRILFHPSEQMKEALRQRIGALKQQEQQGGQAEQPQGDQAQ